MTIAGGWLGRPPTRFIVEHEQSARGDDYLVAGLEPRRAALRILGLLPDQRGQFSLASCRFTFADHVWSLEEIAGLAE